MGGDSGWRRGWRINLKRGKDDQPNEKTGRRATIFLIFLDSVLPAVGNGPTRFRRRPMRHCLD